MHAVMRDVPNYLIRDLPPFAVAMVIAEFLYKFGSFTFECIAFLATWYGLSMIYRAGLAWIGYRPYVGPRSGNS